MSVTHSTREIAEGTQFQGVDEEITYQIDVSNWGSSPTSVSMVVLDNATRSDVTSVVTTGSISVNGNVITLKTIRSLVAGTTYRVEVKFTISGNVLEAYMYIQAED